MKSPTRVYECPRVGCGARFGRVSLLEKHEKRSHWIEGGDGGGKVEWGLGGGKENGGLGSPNNVLGCGYGVGWGKGGVEEGKKDEGWTVDVNPHSNLGVLDGMWFEDLELGVGGGGQGDGGQVLKGGNGMQLGGNGNFITSGFTESCQQVLYPISL